MLSLFGEVKGPRFSKEAVGKQLQKILRDPHFESSKILARFLVFIVEETLHERANTLKEYTIAINVLEKPPSFSTQASGIVRIHASRLRRALNAYYERRGILDRLRISVPKGGYIPVFSENGGIPELPAKAGLAPTIVAITPFRNTISNSGLNNFAEGLSMQLSTSLAQLNYFSVIAYYMMRDLASKNASIEQIAVSTGAQLLITGDIQEMGGQLRTYIQVIRMKTCQTIRSHMYENKISAENIFGTQDDIVQTILAELEEIEV
jgi:TolB-like protein